MKLKIAFLACVLVAGLAASLAVATPPPGKGKPGTTTGTTTNGKKAGKVTVCHKTKSQKHPYVKIRVNGNAVRRYLKHGDVLPAADGSCPSAPTTTTSTTTTTTG